MVVLKLSSRLILPRNIVEDGNLMGILSSFARVIQKWCLELTQLTTTESRFYDALFLLFQILVLLWSLKLLFKIEVLNRFYIRYHSDSAMLTCYCLLLK